MGKWVILLIPLKPQGEAMRGRDLALEDVEQLCAIGHAPSPSDPQAVSLEDSDVAGILALFPVHRASWHLPDADAAPWPTEPQEHTWPKCTAGTEFLGVQLPREQPLTSDKGADAHTPRRRPFQRTQPHWVASWGHQWGQAPGSTRHQLSNTLPWLRSFPSRRHTLSSDF